MKQDTKFFEKERNVAFTMNSLILMETLITFELQDLLRGVDLGWIGKGIIKNFSKLISDEAEFENDMERNKELLSFLLCELQKVHVDIAEIVMDKIDWSDNPLEETFLANQIEGIKE